MYLKTIQNVLSHLHQYKGHRTGSLSILQPTKFNSNFNKCSQFGPSRLISAASSALCNVPQANSAEPESNQIFQEKIKIAENLEVNYGKIGHGPKVVLCIPGIFGTIETDFEPIMKKFDHSQFTMLSLDFPGYGKSRPPSRKIGKNPFADDAKVVELLMKKLEIPKYSIIGWSNGGATGIHVIAKNPTSVEKLVFWSTPAFINSYLVQVAERMVNPQSWNKKRLETMLEVYDEGELKKMLQDDYDYLRKAEETGSYKVDTFLPSIKQPTLILHGKGDIACTIEHPRFFHDEIKNSLLEVWTLGRHDLHLECQDRFVSRVQKFILHGK